MLESSYVVEVDGHSRRIGSMNDSTRFDPSSRTQTADETKTTVA